MIRSRGFTLIELMVVVAIVAILAAIAYPSYTRYAFRARRVDGQNLLLQVANAEERFYSTHNQYTDDLTEFGYTDPQLSEKGYYSVAVAFTGDAAQAYVATATAEGVQASDACGDLAVTSAGEKTPDASDAAHNTNGSCW